jgi:hypothetical protein
VDKKNDDTSGATGATAPSGRAFHAGDGGAVAGPARRLSAKRKRVAVQRLMRGKSLGAVSRDLNVAVHRLSEWRDRVLMAAESTLMERERDERDDEIAQLPVKVGEITMPFAYAGLPTSGPMRRLARPGVFDGKDGPDRPLDPQLPSFGAARQTGRSLQLRNSVAGEFTDCRRKRRSPQSFFLCVSSSRAGPARG